MPKISQNKLPDLPKSFEKPPLSDAFIQLAFLKKSGKLTVFLCLFASLVAFGPSKKDELPRQKQAGSLSQFAPSTISVDSVLAEIEASMVVVAGGSFLMGNGSIEAQLCEKPEHEVTVSSFAISKFEVKQQWFQTLADENPSKRKSPAHPVEQVSWDDAQKFIRMLNLFSGKNYRLPTEAEWEFAARGGIKSAGFKFSGSNNISEVAWHFGNSGLKPGIGGKKMPNELGLFDMSGNVYEWCNDWFGEHYYKNSPQNDPQGPATGMRRVYRGGGWGDNTQRCQSTCRNSWFPENRADYFGFRLALDLK